MPITRTVFDFARVSRRMRTAMDRALEKTDLSRSECDVALFLLAMQPLRDSEIAKGLVMDRPLLSRVVKALIGKGIVQASPYPLHRSQRLLSLSESGSLLAREIETEATKAVMSEVERLDERGRVLAQKLLSLELCIVFDSNDT